MARALVTDLYQLTMASSYLQRGMTAPATFSLFVRDLPPTRGFLVTAGLENCLQFLEEFRFEAGDLDYMATLGLPPDVLQALSSLRFTGDVWAVPEGRVVLANEPLLEVTAPLPEAQIVETLLLNKITFQTAVASKAARCVLAAQGRFELVDFGLRRTHGIEAGMAAARASAMVGFTATSNVEAARRYGLSASGTMAHSYVEAFPEEIDAFRAFATDFPERTTLLADTYDTLIGVRRAITVIKEFGLEDRAAVRLDSGDLSTLTFATRQLLDEAGLGRVRIVVSGNLDEHRVAELVRDGAPVDIAGVGTRMGVSADAPYLDTAYKLVEYNDRPVAKLSTGKATYPGAKQFFRKVGALDTLALRHERGPKRGAEPVLEPVMEGGRRLCGPEGLDAAHARFCADVAALPSSASRLVDPLPPAVAISASLAELMERIQQQHRTQ
jgi:nicotinate phosphoribosyltransferase